MHGDLFEYDYLITVYDDFGGHSIDDAELADACAEVERLILLIARKLTCGQDGKRAGGSGRFLLQLSRGLFLNERVGLVRDRRKEAPGQRGVSFPKQISREPIALPELEGEAIERALVGDGAEEEPAVRLQVVVLVKCAPAFERKVGRVDEVFVKLKPLRVDVIDSGSAAVYDKHDVRERVKPPAKIDSREAVELGPRIDARKRVFLGFAALPCECRRGRRRDCDADQQYQDCSVCFHTTTRFRLVQIFIAVPTTLLILHQDGGARHTGNAGC